MNDFLFSVGVFDDDDRPTMRQHGPVCNVDEQPIQAHQWQHFCPGCDSLLVDPAFSGLCKGCDWQKKERDRRRARYHEERKAGQIDVAAIVGTLCAHCGVRRRKHGSKVCGQRACGRHE